MEKYFILKNTDDGIKVEMITKEELLERITPDKHGYTYYGDERKFINYIPKNVDGYFEEDNIIIIKGDFVIPKAKKVIIEYEL